MTNWANATLAAWFGAQNCYLDMAAMRPGPPVDVTGWDLPQRRQPQNGRHDHFTNAGACRRFGAAHRQSRIASLVIIAMAPQNAGF
jgi:hypothetical protein